MALDVRRYQQARDKKSHVDVDISISTFPGLITLSVGVFVIIVGVILLAAFGVPKDLNQNKKPLSGVTILAFGLFLSAVGMLVALYLKRKNVARKKARKRAEQRRLKEQQQLEREQRLVTAGADGVGGAGYHRGGEYEPQQLVVPPPPAATAHGHHTKVQPAANEVLYGNNYYGHLNGPLDYDQQMALTNNTAVPVVYS